MSILRVVFAAVLLGIAAAPASAAPRGETLTLTPSRAVGIASEREALGPFGLINTSRVGFESSPRAVMLAQSRDGGIGPAIDAASARRAAALLALDERPMPLRAGARLSVRPRLRRPTREHNFYGGVVLRNVPTLAARTRNIRQAYELTASLLLRPPVDKRRIRLRGEEVRVVQDGARRLLFLTSVHNSGNVDVRLHGVLRVRRVGGGPVLLRRRIGLPMILPGAVVDLSARTRHAVLSPGRYAATASLRGGKRRVRVTGTFRLYGPNAVATRAGRLEAATAKAEAGAPGEVRASWSNRGNIPFGARLVAELRRVGTDAVLTTIAMPGSRLRPGRRAEVRAGLPALRRGSYELTVRLLDGRRELDRRTVALTPTLGRGLAVRLRDWLRAHPFEVPLAMLALLAVAAGALVRSRRQAAARITALEAHIAVLEGMARHPAAGRPAWCTADAVLAQSAAPGIVPRGEPAKPGPLPEFRATVDLNHASADELAGVPGIGVDAARRIVRSRAVDGPFRSVGELERVLGFSAARVHALSARLTA